MTKVIQGRGWRNGKRFKIISMSLECLLVGSLFKFLKDFASPGRVLLVIYGSTLKVLSGNHRARREGMRLHSAVFLLWKKHPGPRVMGNQKKKMVIFWQTMMWSPTGGSRFVLWVHNLEYVNIFLLKIFILLVFTVYVCITVCLCMWAQVKTLESPELELKWLWVPHCRTWGLNLGPLKSKCVLVTTEPSLSPLTFSNATFFLGLSQSQIKWWLQRIPVKTTEN